MRRWWNGRHACFRRMCPFGREGSNPFLRILERWLSSVQHRTRNPASGFSSRAGSNPVLSFYHSKRHGLCSPCLFYYFIPASRSPSDKRAKSSKLRASPRTDGFKSAAWIPASSLALISSVLPKRLVKLFQSVLRRWTKLALLTVKKKSSSLTVTAGSSRRTILRIAESTFGAGTKTVRGTIKATLAVI